MPTTQEQIQFDENGNRICPDCLCHYTNGMNHDCPGWLKLLIQSKKKSK